MSTLLTRVSPGRQKKEAEEANLLFRALLDCPLPVLFCHRDVYACTDAPKTSFRPEKIHFVYLHIMQEFINEYLSERARMSCLFPT